MLYLYIAIATALAGFVIRRLFRVLFLRGRERPVVLDRLQHPVVKVFAKGDGSVVLDGMAIDAAGLAPVLVHVKAEGGTVYYARENGQSEATRGQMEIFDQIAAMQVPIGLYTDQTFSVALGP